MKHLLVVLCMCALCTGAFAQKAEVFGGYSFSHVSTSASSSTLNTNGWNGAFTGYFNRYVGVTANFSGDYGQSSTTVVCAVALTPCGSVIKSDIRNHTITFGPQVRVPVGKMTLFAHGLFGVAHASDKVSGFTATGNSFASGFGGGVDYKVTRLAALRLGQFDYIHSSPFNGGINQFRYSTGLVLRF